MLELKHRTTGTVLLLFTFYENCLVIRVILDNTFHHGRKNDEISNVHDPLSYLYA